jgi:hypothetical protein
MLPTPAQIAEIKKLHADIGALIDLEAGGGIDHVEMMRRFAPLDDRLTALAGPFFRAALKAGVEAAEELVAVLPGGFYRTESLTWVIRQRGERADTRRNCL